MADSSPIKVYVGATEEQLVPFMVLGYTIRKHTSLPVDIMPLYQSGIDIPLPIDPLQRPFTTFSFQRFTIPQIQQYQGRAIYLDSDMIVFKDLRQLWEQPFKGAQMLAVAQPEWAHKAMQFSVLLIDCERLRWNIKKIVADIDNKKFTYHKLMHEFPIVDDMALTIPPEWNALERYEDGKTKLLHYTLMHLQPWVSIQNRLAYLWFRLLFETLDEKIISPDLIKDHIERGFLRPSLWWQIENRCEDPRKIPKAIIKAQDAKYKIPFYRPPSLSDRMKGFVREVWKQVSN